jgi:hypothetical protein
MSNPKLPVWATVRQAYAAVRAQSSTLANIAQRWGIAAAVGLAFGAWMIPAGRGGIVSQPPSVPEGH